MEWVDGRLAYTLTEAAARLHVTPQRVCQLLKRDPVVDNRALSGPSTASSGRRYAPRGAPRVWKDSVDAYLERNVGGKAEARAPALADPNADVAAIRRWVDGQERRLRASAQELKIAADHVRDQLHSERRQRREESRRLLRLVVDSAAVVGSLANEIVSNAAVDNAALQHYANALTQLLAFDTPDEIHGD